MEDKRGTEQELAELREEVRHLQEEQERLRQSSGNGQHGTLEQVQQEDRKQEPAQAEGPKESEHEKEAKKPNPLRKWLIIAGVIVVVIVGVGWWLYSRTYEDTDDAYVDGHISGLASRISGTVTAVYVEENQPVNAGQVVVDLDPRDYQVALDQARGQLLQARQQRLAEQPNVPVTEQTNQTEITVSGSQAMQAEQSVAAAEHTYQAALARLREAEANNAKAQADVGRYGPLAAKDEVSKEMFDQVTATAKAQAATVLADQENADAASSQLDESRQALAQAQQRAAEIRTNAPRQLAIRQADVGARQAALDSAQAAVDQAMLNLSYCHIVTPVSGIVARRIAEVGEHVAPGQEVALVSETNDLWVTANFRETQLGLIHPGQSVRIHVDTFGKDFDGYVEDMPAASGSVTSILPPENATGNFVKIVQRLPVRIRFKPGQNGLQLLRPGMSVEPTVWVR